MMKLRTCTENALCLTTVPHSQPQILKKKEESSRTPVRNKVNSTGVKLHHPILRLQIYLIYFLLDTEEVSTTI